MNKLTSLHMIIEAASGTGDRDFTANICDEIQARNHCHGINCCTCPFNSPENLDACASELTKFNKS